MKIYSINNYIPFSSKGTTSEVVPEYNNVNKNKTVQQFTTVGAGIGAIVGGLLVHKNIKIHKIYLTPLCIDNAIFCTIFILVWAWCSRRAEKDA